MTTNSISTVSPITMNIPIQKAPFCSLSQDLLRIVAIHLTCKPKDIFSLGFTCRQFQPILHDKFIWDFVFERYLPPSAQKVRNKNLAFSFYSNVKQYVDQFLQYLDGLKVDLKEIEPLLERIKAVKFPLQQLETIQCHFQDIFNAVYCQLNVDVITLFENPKNLPLLEGLTEIYITAGIKKTLPAIAHCARLKLLRLDDNQISDLPDFVCGLRRLKTLRLNDNQITTLPESICKLENLKWLSLEQNEISIFIDSVLKLEKLKCLDFSNNRISTIPDSISLLQNLNWLGFTNNNVTRIPDSISKLCHLTMLYFGGNEICSIPDSICELKNLKHLHIGTKIRVIPDSISKLKALEVLNLCNNRISVIPDSICQLKNLKELYLCDNQISNIPKMIGSLEALESFDLSNNKISLIPDSICKLEKLMTFYLGNNPLLFIFEKENYVPADVKLAGSYLKRHIEFKNFVCESNLSQFVQLLGDSASMETEGLQYKLISKFRMLSTETKWLICELVTQESGMIFLENDFDASGRLFDNMPVLHRAVRKAIATKWDCMSLENKEKAYGILYDWVKAKGVEWMWDEYHAFEHLLRLIEVMWYVLEDDD